MKNEKLKKRTYSHCVFTLFIFLIFNFSLGESGADVGVFQKVRFARGDVDGDGIFEIIAGGRIGAVVSVDMPRGYRRAGLGVYHASGQLLKPLDVREDLQVVQDVAAADLDGDGRDEVVTVGMGRLTLFGWVDRELVEIDHVTLGGIWTDRVAAGDVDDDARAEIAVTVYRVDADAEIGHTRVVIYNWVDNALVPARDWIMTRHVGDLTAVGDGWVMEVGDGEEGGVLQGVNAQGWPSWEVAVAGRPRALSLDIAGNRLVVGSVDGVVRVYGTGRGKPQFLDQKRVSFLSSLLLVPGTQVKLMVGTYQAGIVWVGF